MAEPDYDKLIEEFSKHANESSSWAQALATLLLAKSIEEWLQGAVAELSRIADAMVQDEQ